MATTNDQELVFHQAWLPFFKVPALQAPPSQAQAFQGPSVSVPSKPQTGEFLIILALFSLKEQYVYP